jgi:8-oxo-dGTP pyrophosphatase MutT (NUDIX family)
VEWTQHGERSVYDSDWVRVVLVDVELPDGRRFEHHAVRLPRKAAGAVVHDAERGVLLLWRHRFITDTWGWEIPAGRIEDGETPEQAAAREALEETGWRPGPLRPLLGYHPSNGLTDQRFHVFLADGATHVGDPVDAHEAERVEWVPVAALRAQMQAGRVGDGMSVTALSYALAFGHLTEA